jgi:hypothetical protein
MWGVIESAMRAKNSGEDLKILLYFFKLNE